MGSLRADVLYALRTLRKNPVFTLTAAVTLALGIGATTAIFSVVKAVLLQPLPYREPEQLIRVVSDMRKRQVNDFPIAPADFADIRERITNLDGIAGFQTFRQTFTLPGETEPQQIRSGQGTVNLFRVLGARMAYGRDFVEAEGVPLPPPPQPAPPAAGQPAVPQPPPPAPPPVAVILSHEFWTRRFGANASVVGQVIDLGGGPRVEIVGVLAPGFELLLPPSTNTEVVPDIWFPFRQNFAAGSRNNVFLRVVGRLKSSATVAQAQSQLDALGADLRRQFPIKETAGVYFTAKPMADDLVAEVSQGVWALMGAVVFVLLIACANVANLLLVRTSTRERELAVRTALGGGRARLLRQLLTESLTLAAIGAALGIGLAYLGIQLLLKLDPTNLPRLGHIAIDGTVLGAAVLATVISAVVFGLAPAIRASRANVIDVLRKSGRTAGLGTGRWLRNGVVVAEVALSFVLLVGCGLMIRSFIALQKTDPGFDPNGVLTFQVQGQVPGGQQPEGRAAFVKDLQVRLQALPGVQSVTAAFPLPLDSSNTLVRYGTEEALVDATKFQQAIAFTVQPGYFEAMKTRIVDGRSFTEADNVSGLKVIIIDTIIKTKMFPGQSAVGKTLLARIQTNEPETFQIIGVTEHQRHTDLATEGREGLYIPDAYRGFGSTNRWAIRATGDPTALAPLARAEVAKLGPRLAVVEMQPMSAYVDKAQARTKFALVLIGVFAGIALVLASVGLYGVLTTMARQRTAEIGVRMAFGAGQRTIFRMLVGQGLSLSAIGLVIGVVGAYLMTGALSTLLVGVRPNDPLTFAAIAGLFLVVGFVAAGVPAVRAARLSPTVALRDE